jgi:hypothetical protein
MVAAPPSPHPDATNIPIGAFSHAAEIASRFADQHHWITL